MLLHILRLEVKPIHHDESVNSWWITQITEKGFFPYDPTNYHGPLFFYIQWIFGRFLGDDLWVLRLLTVLSTCFSVFILWKRNYRLGALLWALSPAFFFFSRSAIHEPIFVFFQLIFVLGWIDLYQQKKNALLWIMLGLVGSFTVKETWAISLIAAALASSFLGSSFLVKPFAKNERAKTFQIICAGILIWFVIFTGFLQNLSGAADFFKAFMPWLQTGTHGSGHDKPFLFWFEMLFKYESLFALVLVFSSYFIFKLKKADKKFLFIYSFFVLQFFIYSLIPYKTIWCLITLLWPLCLLIDECLQEKQLQRIFLRLAAILICWQGYWIYRLNFQNPIDFEHPYVYVQSTQEIKNLSDMMQTRVENEQGFINRTTLIVLSDAWPFPWIFRAQRHLRYVNSQLESEELLDLMAKSDLIVTDEDRFNLMQPFIDRFEYTKFQIRKGDREVFFLEKKK